MFYRTLYWLSWKLIGGYIQKVADGGGLYISGEPWPSSRGKKKRLPKLGSLCTPSGARTLDPLIKSQLLYQLS